MIVPRSKGCSWLLVGRSPVCCRNSCDAQDSSTTKNYPVQMPVMLRLEENGGGVGNRGLSWWQYSTLIKRVGSAIKGWFAPCFCHFLMTMDKLLDSSNGGASLVGFIVN